MKRLVLILFIISSLSFSSFAIVGDDYYLNNRESIETLGRAEHVLPNTLRLVLEEGQSDTLYVTLLPEDTRDTFVSWRVSDASDTIMLYPEGHTCRVYGASVGDATVKISTLGGSESEVTVRVNEKREIKAREFEVEREEEKKEGIGYMLMQGIISSLFGFSVMIITVALVFLFKSRGEKSE